MTAEAGEHRPPAWSEKDTRCAVCLRLFPAAEDIARHAEKECDPDPCWCWGLCWVEHGGACDYPADLDDDLALFSALRATEEQRNLLAYVLNGLVLRVERGQEDFIHDAIDNARRVLAEVGQGGHISSYEQAHD